MIIFWGKKSLFGGILVTFEGPLSLYVGLCIVHSIKSTKKSWQGQNSSPPLLEMPVFPLQLLQQPFHYYKLLTY